MKRWETMAVVTVAVLGLLAPMAVHAAGINYCYQKLFGLGDPPGSSGGDFEIYGLRAYPSRPGPRPFQRQVMAV